MRRMLMTGVAGVAVLGAGALGWHVWHHDAMSSARLMMRRGELTSARLVLRGAVRDHPGNAEAHLDLGLVELRLGDAVAAEHELGQAQTLGADEHAVRPLMARTLVDQGRGAEVLARYDAKGLAGAQAADLDVARALAELQAGKLAQARTEADAALRAAPQRVETVLDAARIAAAAGDPAQAAALADQALAIDPHSASALLLRAGQLARAADPGAAAAYGAAAASPEATPSQRLEARIMRAGLLIDAGGFGAARTEVDAVLREAPGSPGGHVLAAILDVQDARWRQADEALEQAGPIDWYPRAALLTAVIKSQVAEPEQALDAATRFHANHPQDLAGTLVLGAIEIAGGRAADAATMLRPVAADAGAGSAARALLDDAVSRTASGGAGGSAGRLAGIEREALVADGGGVGARVEDVSAQASLPASGAGAGAGSGDAGHAASQVVAELRAGRPDAAAEALGRYAALHPPAVQLDLLTGMVRLAQLDPGAAVDAFGRAHAADPASVDALLGLARADRLAGRTGDAAALLGGAVEKGVGGKPVIGGLLEVAGGSADGGVREAALASLGRAHAARPADLDVTAALATLDLRTGHADAALGLADALGRDTPQGLAMRADAERALGHRDAAADAYLALLGKSPGNRTLRDQVANALVAMGAEAQADRLVSAGLADSPDDPVLQAAAVRLAAAKGGIDAGVARAEAFAAHASDPAARTMPGQFLMATGHPDRAAAAFAKARAELPAAAQADLGIALVRDEAAARLAAGDAAGATAVLDKALAAHPDQPVLLESVGEAKLAQNDLDGARRDFLAVTAAEPANVMARNNLAWVEQAQGDLGAARDDATRAYREAPSSETADTLGWTLFESGQPEHALPLLRVAAGSATDPSVRYHLAAALAKTGDAAGARAVLGPVLAGGAAFRERPQAEALARSLDPGK